MIFSLPLGVGHSVLLQLEGVGHVFSNHHISKCSGPPPPPPVLFDQSLRFADVFGLLSESAGDVGGASYLFADEVTVVTSFKEVSGKLSSASIKRSVGRTDTS